MAIQWAVLALSLSVALSGARGASHLGWTTSVSPRLIEIYTQRFGPQTPVRIQGWQAYARQRGGEPLSEQALLLEVNRFFNRLRFVEDQSHWNAADYWATPAESVGSDGADCEDFSIAKYFLLKQLGVPVARLRLTYVKALKLNQAHMVLAYYPKPDADPLVLDNLEQSVRPASQRSDLIPVYSFNDDDVWVEAKGRVGSPRKIRNWNAVLERLEHEASIR